MRARARGARIGGRSDRDSAARGDARDRTHNSSRWAGTSANWRVAIGASSNMFAPIDDALPARVRAARRDRVHIAHAAAARVSQDPSCAIRCCPRAAAADWAGTDAHALVASSTRKCSAPRKSICRSRGADAERCRCRRRRPRSSRASAGLPHALTGSIAPARADQHLQETIRAMAVHHAMVDASASRSSAAARRSRSSPFSSTTTARFSSLPTPRIADCG